MIDSTVIIILVWVVGTLLSIAGLCYYNEKLTLGHVVTSLVAWYFVVLAFIIGGIAYLIVTFSEKCNNVVLYEKKWKCPVTDNWVDNVSKSKKFNDIKKK